MKQGQMDGLCGLYASFNLLQDLLHFHPSFTPFLFNVLKKTVTISYVWNGTNISQLKTILLSGIKYCNKILKKNLMLNIVPHGYKHKMIELIDKALRSKKQEF